MGKTEYFDVEKELPSTFNKNKLWIYENEEVFRLLVENSRDLISIINKDGIISYISPSCKKLLGYSYKDIVGKGVFNVVHNDDIPKVSEVFSYLIRNPDDFLTTELRILDKDKTSRNIEFIIKNFIRNPDVNGVLCIGHDITEWKKEKQKLKNLEEQLYHAQKMEAIGRLVTGISHDFKNILSVIMGYSEVLKLKFDDDSTKEGKALLAILKNAERASKLIEQLISIAKEEKYNPVILNMNNEIKLVMSVFEKVFEKNIDIVYDFAENLFNIEADRSQIDQVIMNLVINAKDAMPDGGKLTFKTENIFIGEDYKEKYFEFKQNLYIKVSVSDTGTGIPDKIKDKIFKPFFTTKGKRKGTGLGLTTVYRIIENHGGNIYFHSKEGKGTTFNFYLPATSKDITGNSTVDYKLMKGNGTILFIDDEKCIRDIAKIQLEYLGYKVLLASDGIEAIKIFSENKNKVDLVLLDIMMPNMNGEKIFQELKKIKQEIKVLLISGYSENDIESEILNKCSLGFIQKPFTFTELSRAVYGALM